MRVTLAHSAMPARWIPTRNALFSPPAKSPEHHGPLMGGPESMKHRCVWSSCDSPSNLDVTTAQQQGP